ncbi:MAG: Stage V sporulation protein E [Parcubacteria group bacterium GW2011_GWA2_49_9]|nr:MAG: Stage V sporulation protein E [Parcubacteria group bacterium GW2011_GWA2_49_9]
MKQFAQRIIRTYFTASNKPDTWLLSIVVCLVVSGLLIFLSASLGLLARDGASFGNIATTRLLATILGAGVAYVASVFHYKHLRRYTLAILLAAIVLTALVFIPGIGQEHGGARRWISLFGFWFQPAEFLKIAFVIYTAAFFATVKDKVQTFTYGLLPLFALLGIAGFLLLLQPDTDTFVVLFMAMFAIFLAAGGRLRHIGLMLLVGVIAISLLIASKPYLMNRVTTFLNPAADPQGTGWQVQQSLIAIGSGGLTGKGFGQSVQKFSYLPEPIGDSIFAVAGEEFGFIGTVTLILLFLALLLRGLRIASRAPDLFSGLLSIGIVILIGASAFMNIASMLAIIPLSGLTLAFVSHGGTSLVITLFEAGILLNISRYQKS